MGYLTIVVNRFRLVTLALSLCVLLVGVVEADIYEDLVRSQGLKERLGLKVALCQHPMYLIIDEDRGEPRVGERVAPWGAANAKDYVERVRRNLDSLEKFDELRLNYQFSAVEMQAMADGFPAVVERMKRMYEKGSLDFIDGSFSQAHLHTVGAESNWRQFEYGLEVFGNLFGKQVRTYARQETGLHEQIPQLLRLFGYKYMVMPCFWWIMEVTEGPFELTGCEKMTITLQGDEFFEAVSPDGSTIPAYLYTHVNATQPEREISKGLFGSPKIWIYFPDLAEIRQETVDKYVPLFDIVLLEDALAERLKQAPPRAKGHVYSYWSYTEGVWAEELLRANKEAEEAAALGESMYCMGKLAGVESQRAEAFKKIWQTILKYQHHDVHWIEVTDLRRKAINHYRDGIERSRQVASEAANQMVAENNNSVAVFNALPRKRRCLVEADSGRFRVSDVRFQQFRDRVIGFVEVPAGGFASFRASGKALQPVQGEALPEIINTRHYRVHFSQEGLMDQIITREGKRLLRTGDYLGGEMRCLIGDKWVDNRSAECRFYEGRVADVLERDTKLGDIPAHETYFFFKNEPVIKVEIEFDFDGNEVGYFWLDETKINVYYPTLGHEVYHDIPFGYVRARENRPLFATNWLYCGGLAYVNRGTIKHWVKDGVIANVIAWGGSCFSNRTHWGWSRRTQYDLGLYGKQKIEYLLVPYGEFDGNQIVKDVDAVTWPVFITKGAGRKSFYELKDEDLVVTSVFEKAGQVWARGYKLPSEDKSQYRDWEIFNRPLSRLSVNQ